MGKDLFYEAMKTVAKQNGVKSSPQHDLYCMRSPYFINAFYQDAKTIVTPGKINVTMIFSAKYPYFDELLYEMTSPGSTLKFTDKIRANSVAMCRSVVGRDTGTFDFDPEKKDYTDLAVKTFEYMKDWYARFFEDVEKNYGDLKGFFLANADKYPMKAALICIHEGDPAKASEYFEKAGGNLRSVRWVKPETKEQEKRLTDSNAKPIGSKYERADLDCCRDFATAKIKGLEWTPERALYGLTAEERA